MDPGCGLGVKAREDVMRLRVAAVLSAAIVIGASGAEARELRVGLITPPPHVWTRAAERMAERLPEVSGGVLSLEVFPGGQLGIEPDMLQQLGSGLLDMGVITAALSTLRAPSFNAWFTPYLFADVDAAAKATDTPAAQEMLAELERANLVGLGYTFAGMRHVLMRDEPASGPEDLRAKKIRIVPFPAMKVWWDAIGAVPTPVQLTEVYQALQNGVIDGIDIDLDALVGLKFQEVASALTLTNHMAFPAVAMVSKPTWDSLSDEEKDALRSVVEEALQWATEEQMAAETRNLDSVRDALEIVEVDGETAFSRANQAFQNEYGGEPLISTFQEQVRAQADR